jgi:hypothetical protein
VKNFMHGCGFPSNGPALVRVPNCDLQPVQIFPFIRHTLNLGESVSRGSQLRAARRCKVTGRPKYARGHAGAMNRDANAKRRRRRG